MKSIQVIECPRDAMQGWKEIIPTEKKAEYLNALLDVGFHTLDFGSFVSAKAIPQMSDTKEVLKKLNHEKIGLNPNDPKTKLLAIVANTRGAEEAVQFNEINYLGYPFSISPTFQIKNTNSTITESLVRVDEIQNISFKKNKELVVYLSMGFGNPYGDEYNEEILLHWASVIVEKGIKIISLADTVGVATPEQITLGLKTLIPLYNDVTIGVHLHSTPFNWKEKINAAVDAGCTRIDGALKGIGGCPMAGNELVGNMNTELIISYLEEQKIDLGFNKEALKRSLELASLIFS